MPVYEMTIKGVDKPRLVRADTPAAARNHVVACKGVSAERMSDLMEEGIKVERAITEVASGDVEVASGSATAAPAPEPIVADEAAPRDNKGHTPAEGVAAIQDGAKRHAKSG